MRERRPRYVVTGASGFIGRELCERLAAEGDAVRALVRARGRAPLPDGAEQAVGDVLDPASLARVFDGLDENAVCIHTAAHISVKRYDPLCRRVNVEGTQNVLAACRAAGVRKLVHFSSVDALLPEKDGPILAEPERFFPERLPTSYGQSKAEAAQLVLDADGDALSTVALMPSAVMGPGDYRGGLVTRMLELSRRGLLPVSIGGGYDFVDVRDVANGALAAANGDAHGCFLLTGRYTSITEVFGVMAELTGRHRPLLTLPLWTLYPVTPILSLWSALRRSQPPITADALRLMALHPRYDSGRAKRELGFAPRPIEATIADTAAFLRAAAARQANA